MSQRIDQMPASFFTFLDYSGERSTMRFTNDEITAVSLPGFLTQFGDVRDALAAITLGTIAKESAYVFDTVLSNELPADPHAQREEKLLVSYRDTTSQKLYSLEIPTIDRTALTIQQGDPTEKVALDDGGVMAAFVTAFEAIASPPDAPGNNVEVLSARIVYRRT